MARTSVCRVIRGGKCLLPTCHVHEDRSRERLPKLILLTLKLVSRLTFLGLSSLFSPLLLEVEGMFLY